MLKRTCAQCWGELFCRVTFDEFGEVTGIIFKCKKCGQRYETTGFVMKELRRADET